MTRFGIRHLSFALGDEAVWYRDLPGIEERIRTLDVPDEEELWNWGWCRRSTADYDTHVARGYAGVVDHLRTAGVAVDAVLVCGPFQNSTDHFVARLSADVLPSIGTPPERVRRVDDRDCANLLQAVADAREIFDGGAREVLVLAAEKMEDERVRFRSYSIFSDFTFALLLSTDLDACDYEVVDVEIGVDPDPAADTSKILTRPLEKQCVGALLARNGLAATDVAKFFYLNLFEPVAEMKGKDTGFTARQLHSRAKEWGHCYGADPFLNLHHHLESGGGDVHLLCASGRGHAGMALLRRLR